MAATDGAPGGAAAPPAAAWQETAKPQDRSSKGRTKARQRGGLGSGARADVVAEAFLPEGTEAARYVDADASPPVLRDATHRVHPRQVVRAQHEPDILETPFLVIFPIFIRYEDTTSESHKPCSILNGRRERRDRPRGWRALSPPWRRGRVQLRGGAL
jgi:hypothetical protein